MTAQVQHTGKHVAGLTIRLHPDDNVVVARQEVALGMALPEEAVTSRAQIPAGYKLATREIQQGEAILKYNVPIGFASRDISAGDMVHSHNVAFEEFDRDYRHAEGYVPVTPVPANEVATFQGIVRENGQVATRNYVAILSTVNCSATVARKVADWFTEERLVDFPNVDGVVAFPHSLGCGMEMTGEPMALLRRTIAGYARHANFAAVLIVGLGCERNQINGLLEEEGLDAGGRLQTFTMQAMGGRPRPSRLAWRPSRHCYPRPTASSASRSLPPT